MTVQSANKPVNKQQIAVHLPAYLSRKWISGARAALKFGFGNMPNGVEAVDDLSEDTLDDFFETFTKSQTQTVWDELNKIVCYSLIALWH